MSTKRYELPVLPVTPKIAKGNAKLGKGIYVWSLPAGITCPGKSNLCARLCYAMKHRFATGRYFWGVLQNWLIACTPFFVWWIIARLRALRCIVVRVHVSGDFFNATYVRQWITIAKALPDRSFYAYTRSWHAPDPQLRTALAELSQLPNFELWYSWDQEMGPPRLTAEERFVRLAYLSTAATDEPQGPADLIFRDYPVRGIVKKHINGTLVCPEENGTGVHIGCTKCGICWKTKRNPRRQENTHGAGRLRQSVA